MLNRSHPLFLSRAHTEWNHQWILEDTDGSLTESGAGSSIIASSTIYDATRCHHNAFYDGRTQGVVCKPSVKLARFAFNNLEPSDTFEMAELLVKTKYGEEIVEFHFAVSANNIHQIKIISTEVPQFAPTNCGTSVERVFFSQN